MSYSFEPTLAIHAAESERAAFIRRTYAHLAAAILAFIGLEYVLLHLPNVDRIVGAMIGTQIGWLFVFGGFMLAGWVANAWARSNTSVGMQYLGLALYVVAESIITLPLLYIAVRFSDPSLITTAGIMTLSMFGGLTMAVFVTRKDFTFLGPIISVASFVILGALVASWFIGGFTFGLVIAFGIIALASAAILYQTSAIMLYYNTQQHVAAALGLFASVANLFYHILLVLLSTRDN